MVAAVPTAEAGTRRPRIAANPITYWKRDGTDKSRAVLDQAFTEYAAIGFTVGKSDVPESMSRRSTWNGSAATAWPRP
jgi:hypothetical protein